MRTRVLFLAGLLAGCTAITARNDPPTMEFSSSKTVGDAVGCVVRHMSAGNAGSFTASTVEVGRVFEIHPTRELMVGGEPIFARVEAKTAGSQVTGHGVGVFRRTFSGMKEACG